MEINLGMKDICNIRKIILSLSLSFVVTSCSAYNSSFSCPDAKGGTCMSIDKIDHLIKSGEIERVTKTDTKCHGLKCKSKSINLSNGEAPVIIDKRSNDILFTDDLEKR